MAISADEVQKYLLERADRAHAEDAYMLRSASGFIDQLKAQSLKLASQAVAAVHSAERIDLLEAMLEAAKRHGKELESRLDKKQLEFDRLLARDTDNLKRLIECQSRLDRALAVIRDALEHSSPIVDTVAAANLLIDCATVVERQK